MAQPLPRIGVDMLYVAQVLQDTADGTQYGGSRWLQGLNNIGYDLGTQSQTYDADDSAYAVVSGDGNAQLAIRVADLTPEDRAWILGLMRDQYGVVSSGTTDNPPEMSVGFRSQKSNGQYRFVWLLKGRFQKGSETYTTKGSNGITFNDTEIIFTALNRASDGKKDRQIDSDDPAIPAGMTVGMLSDPETGWFSSPNYIPTVTGSPISDLVATTGAGDNGTIDLTFSAPAGATSAKVQAKQIDGSWVDVQTAAAITASSTTATVTGLVAGNTYTLRMIVVGGEKAGASNEQSAKAKGGA